MAVELAGTWVFDDRLFGGNLELLDITFLFNFDSNGYHFTGLALSQSTRSDNEINFMVFGNDNDYPTVYTSQHFGEDDTTSDRWLDENFKTITITSKLSEVTDGDVLLTWLQANATKIETDTSKKLAKLRYKASDVCQLMDKSKYPASKTSNGITFTNNDGVITANGTATTTASYSITDVGIAVIGHKYLLAGGVNNLCYIDGYIYVDGSIHDIHFGNDTGKGYIFTANVSGMMRVLLRVVTNYAATNVMFKPQLFDLTEMYGAGNEPTTLTEFRQKYPNDLYPYSPQCWYSINKIRYMSNQYGNSVLTDSISVYYKDSQKFFYIAGWSGAELYKRVFNNAIPKMGLLDYKAVGVSTLYDDRSNDKTVSLGNPGMYDNFIMVRDLSFNGDTEKFKQFIIGNNVWFELETPAQGGYLPLNKGVKI